jgi:hypothetical protein
MEALARGVGNAVVNQGRIVQHGLIDEVFRRTLTPAIGKTVAVESVQRAHVLRADEELATVAVGKARLIAGFEPCDVLMSDGHVLWRTGRGGGGEPAGWLGR